MLQLLMLLLPFLCVIKSNKFQFYEASLCPAPPIATAVYDPSTEYCCDGKAQPKSRIEKCCGKKVYKPTRELCCEGVVYELKLGLGCCDNKTYDPENQICCGQKAIDLDDPTNPHLQCCSDKVYDMTKQKCCQLTHNISTLFDTLNPNNVSCCGNQLYDPDIESCCQNNGNYRMMTTFHVYNKSKFGTTSNQCCGTQPWDMNKQSCCGNVTYDQKEQICCYLSQDETVLVNISKSGINCCGSSGKTYDFYTQLCCMDVIVNKSSNSACCGNKTINSTEELCCSTANGTFSVKKEKPDHYSCCLDKSFGLAQLCCLKDNKSVVYDQENERYDYQCCGIEKYHTKKQICCGDKVFDQPADSSLGCCGKEIYNTKKQTCCFEEKRGVRSENATIINDIKPASFCCAGELYTASSNKGCCKNKVYNTLTEVCCQGKIFSKEGKESRNKCCFENKKDRYKEERQYTDFLDRQYSLRDDSNYL